LFGKNIPTNSFNLTKEDIVNKKNLCVVKAVSKDETRYVLTGLCLDKEHTVATSGRMLAAVTYPKMEAAGIAEVAPLIISRKHVIELNKLFDKKSALTVLKEGEVCTITLTREKDKVDLQFIPIEGQYPTWQHVLPKDPPEVIIPISPYLLGQICEMVLDFQRGDKGVPLMHLEVWDYNSPIMVKASSADTGQDFIGVVMPMWDKAVEALADAKEAARQREEHAAGAKAHATKDLIKGLVGKLDHYANKKDGVHYPAVQSVIDRAKVALEGGD